jgi:two-component system NtrC family sensor kinase
MAADKIKILLVDDDEDDYIITRDLLSEIGELEFQLDWVGTYGTALEVISRGEHHVYLVDFGLGERNGLELLRDALARGCKAPIILLTGQGDHEIDIEAMKAGAADYLVKGQILAPLLERSIRYAIERGQTLQALRNSEDEYRRLFNSHPVPMWVCDTQTYRFLAVNDAAMRSYGYSSEEFLRMTIRDIRPAEDVQAFVDEIAVGLPEYGVTGTRRHLRKDGSIFDAETTSHEIAFGGRPARLVMAVDITERKRMEAALRKSEEHFRSLTENALDLISIIDLDRRVRYQSPSSERALGYAPDELVGKRMFDFVHPDDAESLGYALDLIVASPGVAYSAEFRFHHRDGSWRVLEAIGKMPANESGTAGIVLNSRDITERKYLQEQLIQSEKLAALGRLISGIAHELNNPLTSVIGYTQLVLSQGGLEPGLRERLEVVSREGERARRIVQNMLSFARQHRPGRAGVDLNTLLDMTLDLRSYELGVCNIKVKREFGQIGEIIGDAHLLQQVFLNIIINAEQAMRQADIGGTLLVRTEETAIDSRRWVKISIVDDGPGMPEEILGKVFDPFFTTKNVGEGTGLGLSISYGIIKEHGGSISVQSAPGRGTAFVIELPCQPDQVQSCSVA